jgi:predicted small lipoprotein YifL
MKHKAFRWIPAVLLAALLAGCGAETAPPASAAAPASVSAAASTDAKKARGRRAAH